MQKRREDNIKEWTGLRFVNSHRAAEDTKKWRELVARSSVITIGLRDKKDNDEVVWSLVYVYMFVPATCSLIT